MNDKLIIIMSSHPTPPLSPPGYDLSAEGGVKSMLEEFDQTVGLDYLRAIHFNDS